jgi:hypothetical protein
MPAGRVIGWPLGICTASQSRERVISEFMKYLTD